MGRKDLGLVMLDEETQLVVILTLHDITYNTALNHPNFSEGRT